MTAHTPGPWKWWIRNGRRLVHYDQSKLINVLMPQVSTDGQPDIAVIPQDMALIEAAPELLAALKACLFAMEAEGNWSEAIDQAHTVIDTVEPDVAKDRPNRDHL